jgi:hypothetical protein
MVVKQIANADDNNQMNKGNADATDDEFLLDDFCFHIPKMRKSEHNRYIVVHRRRRFKSNFQLGVRRGRCGQSGKL